MTTVTEIKRAIERLPPRQKRDLARWLQVQVSDRPMDDELMAAAVEGAQRLDRREAAPARRAAR